MNKAPESLRNSQINNIPVPNYHLNTSRHQFLYSGITTWNKLNIKAGLQGNIFPSDLSISSCIAKKQFKEILLNIQSSGDYDNWEKQNLYFD